MLAVVRKIDVFNVYDALRGIELLKSKNGNLGRVLKVPEHMIETFERNNPTDPEQVRIEIIKYWWKNQPNTWRAIAEAAERLGEKEIAAKIRSKLCTFIYHKNGHVSFILKYIAGYTTPSE